MCTKDSFRPGIHHIKSRTWFPQNSPTSSVVSSHNKQQLVYHPTEVVLHKDDVQRQYFSEYAHPYLALSPPNGSSQTATLQGDVSFLEKQSNIHSSASSTLERIPYKVRFAHINERKVMNKIDFRVVPVLCLLYLLAFLDRVNISNAAIFGLKRDLDLHGTQYNTALVIL